MDRGQLKTFAHQNTSAAVSVIQNRDSASGVYTKYPATYRRLSKEETSGKWDTYNKLIALKKACRGAVSRDYDRAVKYLANKLQSITGFEAASKEILANPLVSEEQKSQIKMIQGYLDSGKAVAKMEAEIYKIEDGLRVEVAKIRAGVSKGKK